MGKVIGIDLGTTNSCVAILEGGKPTIITNSQGSRTTPSVVGFEKSSEAGLAALTQRLVGRSAKRQVVTNAENTIYSIKRFIGRRWEDTEAERVRVPYTCVKGKDDTVDVKVRGTAYTTQEISAIILQKLKQDAEKFLGEPIKQAVITVPAYFTDAQRQATKDAGAIAGLEVLRIINEPTAAALAYGLDHLDQEQQILVFDLGGGTFDVSILQLGEGVFEVKATAGNNHLGGDDFDQCIVTWVISRFQEQEKIDLSLNKIALQRLREAAEKAKIELSKTSTTSIHLPFITTDKTGPKHLEIELSRSKFEELVSHLVRSTIEPINQALKDCDSQPADIDHILLVGGSTRMPVIQNAVQEFFGGRSVDSSVNPDEAVAIGASIQAGVLGGEVEDVLLLDVTPLSLGIETLGEVFTKIIDRNTTIPTTKYQVFSTATDGQSLVEINVLQGARALAKDNKSLGKFLLAGIPSAPRGVPQIEVSFEIDVNGILKVSAQDKGTGQQQSVRITNTGGLSAVEVERMRQEAEMYAEQDRVSLEMIELRNRLDNLFYSYESTLKNNGNLLSEDLKTEANEKMAKLKAVFTDPDSTVEVVKQQLHSFQQTLFTLGANVYEQPTKNTDNATVQTGNMRNLEEFDFDLDEDSTVTVDYEAIE